MTMIDPRLFLCRAATVAFLLAPVASQTGWVQWTGAGANGNWYLAVHAPGGINWADADTKAQELGGVLATIGSAQENAFVYGLVANPIFWRTVQNPTRVFGPWLGGYQPSGSVEPGGGWRWVTTLPWGYTHWASNEPNNYQGIQEDRLHFFNVGTAPASTWNDIRGATLTRGFVVETSVAPVAAATAIGIGCAPAGMPVPALAIAGGSLPRIGSTFQLRLDGYPTSANPATVVIAAGLSNRYASTPNGRVALPISLAPLGWADCNQLVSVDASTFYVTTNAFVIHAFVIPNQPGLLGLPFFSQGFVVTPTQPLLTGSIMAVVGP